MTDTERLDAAILGALGLPAGTAMEDLAYGRTEAWDSVAHLQVVVAIEEAFGTTLADEDVVAMSTYGDVRRILRDQHGLALGGPPDT